MRKSMKPTKTINREEARSLMENHKGHFFKARFTKKDGSDRTMVCRRGVVKHLRGGESTIAHKTNLVSVYDTQAEGYRAINLDTLKELDFDGVHYEIKEGV